MLSGLIEENHIILNGIEVNIGEKHEFLQTLVVIIFLEFRLSMV